jgi:hypothetical protein
MRQRKAFESFASVDLPKAAKRRKPVLTFFPEENPYLRAASGVKYPLTRSFHRKQKHSFVQTGPYDRLHFFPVNIYS